MPKVIENKLKKQAKKEGLKGESYNRYVYGTLAKIEKAKKKKKGKG